MRKRERKINIYKGNKGGIMRLQSVQIIYIYTCVCVCEREREREREKNKYI